MKTQTLNPSALYWALFNRFELRLPGQCVIDCAHSGQCDADVSAWVDRIKAQVDADNFPNKPTPEKVRAELADYGAWDDKELADDNQNWHRLVWCASNNIAEESEPDCSEPLKH